MQNKPNFRNAKMNITLDMISNYKILSAGSGQKTNPIQSQFKPNQSQFWAKIKGGKAKTNPIQTQFTTLKGANLLVFVRKMIYTSGKKNGGKSKGETVLNKFTRRDFLRSIGIGAASLLASRLTKAADRPRPTNIVIIIGDDIGYSDFGCYGGEIQTPNIDKIAANGIRFTQFHSESMCAPTRVALLTGQYHIRGYNSGRNITIAEVLSKAGYRNCAVGKWHNAGEPILNRKAPLERGFDNFFGTPQGCGSFFAPLTLSRDGKPAEDQWKKNKDFYYTDAISDNAVRYIKETPKEIPLFLYTAFTAAHWPLHALPEDIEKQKGLYAIGWDKLRQQRLERMKKIGIVKQDTPLSPRHPNVPAWKDEKHKQWQQRRMEVYAAQITRMDKEPWELYDIEADPVELNNLNRKYPEKAAQLAAFWEKWYKNSEQKNPGEKKNRK